MANILIQRGTREQINAAGAMGLLRQGEPYFITDAGYEGIGRLAIGRSETDYTEIGNSGDPSVFWDGIPGKPPWVAAGDTPAQARAAIGAAAAVVGAITMWLGTAAPPLYMVLNGAAVSRTTHKALFALYGTSYGEGNGSTTFNLPNMSDRSPVGASGTKGLGTSGGAAP